MSSAEPASSEHWLDLSEAAHYLGVHFTTLRRWADAGQVPCIRTPGGRRRFAAADLQVFLESLRQSHLQGPGAGTAMVPLEARTLDVARQHLHSADPGGQAHWHQHFG